MIGSKGQEGRLNLFQVGVKTPPKWGPEFLGYDEW